MSPGIYDATGAARRMTTTPYRGAPSRFVTHLTLPSSRHGHATGQFSWTPVLASPPLDASASPVRSTCTLLGSEPAGPKTPEFARPSGLAVARPVRDTRMPLPGHSR